MSIVYLSSFFPTMDSKRSVRVVFKLRKLCIAVILFSFLGYGPLESYFHKNVKTDGNQENGSTVFQKLKETADSIPLSADEPKLESFLITENKGNNNSAAMNMGMIITRDSANNKVTYGTVPLPVVNNDVDFDQLKKTVEKKYQIPIDHCFIIGSSGLAKIQQMLNELEENNSPNQWLSMLPSLLNEVRHSIKTDLDKGELFQLGLSAMINPITKIEPIQIYGNPSKTVNLDMEDNNQKPMVN